MESDELITRFELSTKTLKINNHYMEYSKTSLRKVAKDITESLGKLPPQALDIEEAVLGALMLEKDALTNSCSISRNLHNILE